MYLYKYQMKKIEIHSEESRVSINKIWKTKSYLNPFKPSVIIWTRHI